MINDITEIDNWFEILAMEKSEYHLPGTFLTLLKSVFPYDSGVFANNADSNIRAVQWLGRNPTMLRRCFSKLKKDGFFLNGFHAVHEVEMNDKYFYFLPMRSQNKLISLAGLESSNKIKEEVLETYQFIAKKAAETIAKNRLEEWTSMTDCLIHILEPIFAAQSFADLEEAIKKGALTLLGSDNAAVYFDNQENDDSEVNETIEKHLARYAFESQYKWVGSIGQYRAEFPSRKNLDSNENLRSLLALPIHDNNGNYIGGIATSYYYTDLPFEEADQKLFEVFANKLFRAVINRSQFIQMEKANAHLEELDAVKEQAMHQVTHDLKTPIGAIKGFSELILQTKVDQDSQKLYIEHIFKSSESLLTMVEDLLDLARLKSTGDFQLKEFELCSVKELISDVCTTTSGISTIHSISHSIGKNISSVNVDPQAIKRVISNFVSNAIKYSPRGGKIDVVAKLVEDQDKKELEISISDEGLGIPEDKIEGLFDSFSRVDTKDHKKIDGTGLGLAICKEIVTAHNGRVWVESEHTVGSTFYFTIPLDLH